MLKLSSFDYSLPKGLIAQYPLKKRDEARLMVLNRLTGAIEHRAFKDIAGYLGKGDLLILNDTKVLPSRLTGRRATGGRVELLLLKQKAGLTFDALIKPKRVKIGEQIIFTPLETKGKQRKNKMSLTGFTGNKITAQLTARNEVAFNAEDIEAVYNLGAMPLPPYIKRGAEELDNIYYQTVYAREKGSVASPTAGLHFTKELIEDIQLQGAGTAYITLHVGLATFRPVKADDITQHKMGEEYFRIPAGTIKRIIQARLENRRILAGGTTSLRALETYARGARQGYTDLFIRPGYKFKMADGLLTNFHLPRTTLFILVCAFAGKEVIQKAYQEAIGKKYRFYSYGDAMLII